MVKVSSARALREALAALCTEREDGGAGLVLQDVCDRAGISRATAYRGEPSFKTEFDDAIKALAAEEVGAPGPSAPDTRASYRKVIAKLANQVQVLALQLEAERRVRGPQPDAASALVLPFPGSIKQS